MPDCKSLPFLWILTTFSLKAFRASSSRSGPNCTAGNWPISKSLNNLARRGMTLGNFPLAPEHIKEFVLVIIKITRSCLTGKQWILLINLLSKYETAFFALYWPIYSVSKAFLLMMYEKNFPKSNHGQSETFSIHLSS